LAKTLKGKVILMFLPGLYLLLVVLGLVKAQNSPQGVSIMMLKNDIKLLRLKDYLKSTIHTTYEYIAYPEWNTTGFKDNATTSNEFVNIIQGTKYSVDDGKNITYYKTTPKSVEINPVKTLVYNTMDASFNLLGTNTSVPSPSNPNQLLVPNLQTMDGVVDVQVGSQSNYMMRLNDRFLLFTVEPEETNIKYTIKGTYALANNIPTGMFVNDTHFFLFYQSIGDGSNSAYVTYYHLENTGALDLRADFECNDGLVIRYKDYIPTAYVKNPNQKKVLGYLPHFENIDWQFYECTIDKNSTETKVSTWTSKCSRFGLDLPEVLSYDLISVSYIDKGMTRLLLRKNATTGSTNNIPTYHYSNCSLQTRLNITKYWCDKATPISNLIIRSPDHVILPLENNLIGVWTQNLLLYSTDDTYTRFEKVYIKADPELIQKRNNITKSTLRVKASSKGTRFLHIAVGNATEVTRTYLVDLSTNPPEIYDEKTPGTRYMRMQGNTLMAGFYSGKIPDSGKNDSIVHQAHSFLDAYALIKGSVFSSKVTPAPPNLLTDTFKFGIKAISQDGTSEITNFTFIELRKPLNALEVSIPFKEIKVIKGGRTSTSLKDEYLIGNDIVLNVTSQTKSVKTTVASNSITKIHFTDENFRNRLTGTNSKDVDSCKVILLWDNLLLVGLNNLLHICYLKFNINTGMTDCFTDVGSIDLPALYILHSAKLLNFNHVLVISKDTKTGSDSSLLNEKYTAIIYNIERTRSGNYTTEFDKGRQISNPFNFWSKKGVDFILYTFPAEAWLMYVHTPNATLPNSPGINDEDEVLALERMFVAYFDQQSNNTYSVKVTEVEVDISQVLHIDTLFPDYSTSHFFYFSYLEVSTSAPKNTEYRYLVPPVSPDNSTGDVPVNQSNPDNSNSKYTMQTVKKLVNRYASGNQSVSDEVQSKYCGARDEIVSIIQNNTDSNTSIFSNPMTSQFSVQERMVRWMPFRDIGFSRVEAVDCMDNRNAFLVLASKTDAAGKKQYSLINYDLDSVDDPRRRVESIVDLPSDFIGTNMSLTAISMSNENKDYIVVSTHNGTSRSFHHVEQPVKVTKFEMFCPNFAPSIFDINLTISIAHKVNDSDAKTNTSKTIKVEAKPIEYNTLVNIGDDKLKKKVGLYELEKSGRLSIRGHLYSVRLANSKDHSNFTGNQISVIERLNIFENITIPNAVAVRAVKDNLIVKVANGNIQILYDRKNRSLANQNGMLVIPSRNNYMDADEVPKTVANAGTDRMWILLGEDIKNGITLNWYVYETNLTKSKTPIDFRTQTFPGIFSNMRVTYCGTNPYFVLIHKSKKSLIVGRIQPMGAEATNLVDPTTGTVTLSLDAEIFTLDLLCLRDSNEDSFSVGLVVLYKNQTQIFFNYNGNQKTASQVLQAELTFLKNRNYFVNDMECEQIVAPISFDSNVYTTKLKCFYSTRWSDDYVVYYAIESGENHLKIVESIQLQTLEEVKDLDNLRTIAQGEYVLVIGENLREQSSQRQYYVMVYKFDLVEKTRIMTYFKVPKSVDLENEQFSDFITIGSDGTVVYLGKSSLTSNVFDTIYRFDLKTLYFMINNTNFDPSQIDLEILDISGDPLERISLALFFDQTSELKALQTHPYAMIIIYIFLAILALLLITVGYYYAADKLYRLQRKSVKKKVAGFHKSFISFIKSQNKNPDVNLDDDDSDEFMDAMAVQDAEETTNKNSGNGQELEDKKDKVQN
jgi:hypothetical protein